MDFLSDGHLNIMDFSSSNLFDKCLHLGLVDLAIMIYVNRVKESVELLLRESVGLTKFSKTIESLYCITRRESSESQPVSK